MMARVCLFPGVKPCPQIRTFPLVVGKVWDIAPAEWPWWHLCPLAAWPDPLEVNVAESWQIPRLFKSHGLSVTRTDDCYCCLRCCSQVRNSSSAGVTSGGSSVPDGGGAAARTLSTAALSHVGSDTNDR
jgi:hypothetical protein